MTSIVMRIGLLVVLGAMTGIAGWWTLFVRDRFQGHELELQQRDARIGSLEQDVRDRDLTIDRLSAELEAAQARVRELELANALLKVDHRVARIEVVEQTPIEGRPGELRTTVLFTELDEFGDPMGDPQTITLDGTDIYLDALVIKFDDGYVEGSDALRGTSVCLFRRMFSETVSPANGASLDTSGTRPHPYRDDAPGDPFFDELWQRFWDYADDPELAESQGVRAMHGEAPYIRAVPGRTYRVELRSSGGLTISPD